MTAPRRLRFWGTGGAGTTTIAAATALRVVAVAEQAGEEPRVLLWSHGPASPVADLLGTPVAAEPREVRAGLWVAAGPVPDDQGEGWDVVVVDGGPEVGSSPLDGVLRLVVAPTGAGALAARRMAITAALHGRPVDAVVVNRVLPAGDDPWLAAAAEAQTAQVVAVERAVPAVGVRTIAHGVADPVGLDALHDLGRALYGEDDPRPSASPDAPLRIERVDGGYAVTVVLPPVNRASIEVGRSRTHLRLAVEGITRELVLPDSLRRRRVTEAAYRDGCLVIHFADPA